MGRAGMVDSLLPSSRGRGARELLFNHPPCALPAFIHLRQLCSRAGTALVKLQTKGAQPPACALCPEGVLESKLGDAQPGGSSGQHRPIAGLASL